MFGRLAYIGGIEYECPEIPAARVDGRIDGRHGALYFCCRGVLGDRLVCERSAYHTAAAYRATLLGGIRHVWFYVLLSAGHQ